MSENRFFVEGVNMPITTEFTDVFNELYPINVSSYVEKKDGLSYLSWSYAWAEVKKRFPSASYQVLKFNGLPYVCDPNTGYMVFTTVTIEGQTHEMWLPVMDGKNKAMKSEPYEYTSKSYGKEVVKSVQAATMFDINKTIMRCLVKNLAMFGLGLYIYSGEDLPESSQNEANEKAIDNARIQMKALKWEETKIFSGRTLEQLNETELPQAIATIQGKYDEMLRKGIDGTEK